jgi:hypothetical protein
MSERSLAKSYSWDTRYRTGLGRWVGVSLVIVVLLNTWSAQAAGRLYRFVNSQGKVEISNSIPNDRVPLGYDVLDDSGRLILRIAPQLTPAQIKQKRQKEAEERACREGYSRVTAMYQTEADIDRFKGQAVEALQSAIANDQANLLVVRGQHAELLAQAARAERSGSTLSAILVQNIDRAKGQIKLLEKSIRDRQLEQDQIDNKFQKEREILRRGPC